MNKQIASSNQVDEAIRKMASSIIDDYADQQPLFVCLLRGAAPFAVKLMMQITHQDPSFHPELDYMMVKTYGDKRSAGQPQIVMDLAPSTNLADRPVIVLDDVLDTGVTAKFVADTLRQRGAACSRIAVLVEKTNQRPDLPQADYRCLQAGPEWLAGMGMDDPKTANEAYRWSEEIIAFN